MFRSSGSALVRSPPHDPLINRFVAIKAIRPDRLDEDHGQLHVNGVESFCKYTKRRLARFNGVRANFELSSRSASGCDKVTLTGSSLSYASNKQDVIPEQNAGNVDLKRPWIRRIRRIDAKINRSKVVCI